MWFFEMLSGSLENICKPLAFLFWDYFEKTKVYILSL